MTAVKVPKNAASALAELAGAVAARDAQQAQASQGMQKLAPALEQVVETFMESGAGRPLKLRGEAAEAFRVAASKLDEADRVEHVTKLRAVLDEANKAAESAWAQEEQRETDLAAAHEAERAAGKRAQEAKANHEKAAEVERWAAQFKSSAAQQTEALMRSRAAADVYARERAAHEGASAARVRAQQALSEAKAQTAAVERAQDAASAALKDPGRIPRSMFTMAMDGIRRYAAREELTLDEQAVVWALTDTIARKLGLDRAYQNDARAEVEKDANRKASSLILNSSSKPSTGKVESPPGTGPIASRL